MLLIRTPGSLRCMIRLLFQLYYTPSLISLSYIRVCCRLHLVQIMHISWESVGEPAFCIGILYQHLWESLSSQRLAFGVTCVKTAPAASGIRKGVEFCQAFSFICPRISYIIRKQSVMRFGLQPTCRSYQAAYLAPTNRCPPQHETSRVMFYMRDMTRTGYL